MSRSDYCPGCGRRILDHDMTGCEAPNGQRWCQTHATDAGLFSAVSGWDWKFFAKPIDPELEALLMEEEALQYRPTPGAIADALKAGDPDLAYDDEPPEYDQMYPGGPTIRVNAFGQRLRDDAFPLPGDHFEYEGDRYEAAIEEEDSE